jgi:hypothetical protein
MPAEFRTGRFLECADADDHMTAFVEGTTWRADVAWAKRNENVSCATWSADEAWVKRSADIAYSGLY